MIFHEPQKHHLCSNSFFWLVAGNSKTGSPGLSSLHPLYKPTRLQLVVVTFNRAITWAREEVAHTNCFSLAPKKPRDTGNHESYHRHLTLKVTMGGSAIGNTLKLMVVKSHHPSCTSLVHSLLGHLSIYF